MTLEQPLLTKKHIPFLHLLGAGPLFVTRSPCAVRRLSAVCWRETTSHLRTGACVAAASVGSCLMDWPSA